MYKRADIDRVDFQPDGTMMVRIAKYLVDDDGTILNIGSDSKYHATSFIPAGQDHEATIAANDADLTRQGFGAVPSSQWDNIRALISAKHTPEVIQAYQDAQAAARAARDAELALIS